MDYQKLIVVGRLGKDAEMRYLPDGKAVVNFSLATGRKIKGEDSTIWFRVSWFGPVAEKVSTWLVKGKEVLVEGILTADKATGGPRLWDRQDGSKGASFEILAYSVTLGAGGQKSEATAAPADETIPVVEDDSIPF